MSNAHVCPVHGCRNPAAAGDVSPQILTQSKLFYLLAFLSLYVGLMLFWVHKASLRNMEHVTIADTFVRRGTLETQSQEGLLTSVVLRGPDGRTWLCKAAQCAYEGIERDTGKPARVWTLDGNIVQIEVDGEIRMGLQQGVDRLQNYPLALFFLGMTPFLALFGWITSAQSEVAQRRF